MNFLAHYLIATTYLPPAASRPYYTVGNALPDLLPLASARMRRKILLPPRSNSPEEQALYVGAVAHLETDAAFHKLADFQSAQDAIAEIIIQAGFEDMRIRRFFVAHILAELALDAALLRNDPQIAENFYSAFTPDTIESAVKWAESALGREIPELRSVLDRFAHSRYLLHYAEDAGVAEGLNRLCARARQDVFIGANANRLARVVESAVTTMDIYAAPLMAATVEAIRR